MMNILEDFKDLLLETGFIKSYAGKTIRSMAGTINCKGGNAEHNHGEGFKYSLDDLKKLQIKVTDIVSNINSGYDITEAQDPSCQSYDTAPQDTGLSPAQRNGRY